MSFHGGYFDLFRDDVIDIADIFVTVVVVVVVTVPEKIVICY